MSSRGKPLKFQPRAANRKAQSERDALAQAEEQRVAARRPVKASTNPVPTRGSASRRYDTPHLQQASGPLGSGKARESSRRTRSGDLQESKHAEPSKVKVESAESQSSKKPPSNAKTVKIKNEDDSHHLQSAELDSSGRVDIAYISLLDSDEELGTETKAAWQTRPVRVDRQEHLERQVGINTEASSELSAKLRSCAQKRNAQDEGLFVTEGDAEQVLLENHEQDRNRWQGVWQDRDTCPAVKTEHDASEQRDKAKEEPSTEIKRFQYRDPASIQRWDAEHSEDEEFDKIVRVFREHRKRRPDSQAASRESRTFIMQLPPLLPRLHDPSRMSADGSKSSGAETSTLDVIDTFSSAGYVGLLEFRESGRITADWGGLTLVIQEEECTSKMAQEVVIMEETKLKVKVEHSEPARYEEDVRLGGTERKVYAVGPASAGSVATLDWRAVSRH